MQIAENAPRTIAELTAMTIPGVSKHMKQKFGKYLVEAVGQVDAFLQQGGQNRSTLDSFTLDVNALFGPPVLCANQIPPTQTQHLPSNTQNEVDWGVESDDDWEGKSFHIACFLCCLRSFLVRVRPDLSSVGAQHWQCQQLE